MIEKETTSRFDQINTLFISLTPDLTGTKAWRYQRQISPGIQEYIEALSFHHYILTQQLITREEVIARLPEGVRACVTEEDYLMGLFDLTGEIMRFAVTGLSQPQNQGSENENEQEKEKEQGGGRKLFPSQAGIVVDLRAMRASFEMLTVPRRHSMFRDMDKKVDVMQNSVEKVERAAYGILVRGSERPAGWMPDFSHGEDL